MPEHQESTPHIPVLLEEVLHAMEPGKGDIVVDATFGAGGYSEAMLERTQAHIVALDRDPTTLVHAERLRAAYGERFTFIEGNFADMDALLAPYLPVYGIMLDIGVSSMQLDTAERGFSFRSDALLDMRMSGSGRMAAEIVNGSSQQELADMIWRYGEERASRRIAAAIVRARAEEPIKTTFQLKEVIYRVLPPRGQKTDPATRTFQALRIAVNDELGALERALGIAESLLREDGRLAVVTFHSLEDRMVKQFFKATSETAPSISRHRPDPVGEQAQPPIYRLTTRKAIKASDAECARNPRARSAKLRAAIRTSAPARQMLDKAGAHA